MIKLNREELIEKLTKSELHYTLKGKGKIKGEFKLINQFWVELFENSEIAKIKNRLGQSCPIVVINLKAGEFEETLIKEVVVKLKRNGKTWYVYNKKIEPIKLYPEDSMELVLILDGVWNGE